MARKKTYIPYAILLLFLFFIISISPSSADKLRKESVASIAPAWLQLEAARTWMASFVGEKKEEKSVELSHLSLENQLLSSQIEGVYEWLSFEERISEQMEKLKEVSKEKTDDLYWNEFFRRRSEELRQILEIELQCLPAKIIFREPSSWSSSVWINVGERENEALGRLIIAKNSPVVLGDSLVGVVEFVGQNESRVRLITDCGLVPSVRAVRGNSQDKEMLQVTKEFVERLQAREDVFASPDDKQRFLTTCSKVAEKLSKSQGEWYLAKGELYGSSHPLWKSHGQVLKGIGFQYSYKDEEGPARDLFSGKPMEGKGESKFCHPLLCKGDLLVTTGMDGVFPAGLHVAIVSKVGALKEGDFAYEIEAKPTAKDLEDLKVVFVMPPLGFDKKE